MIAKTDERSQDYDGAYGPQEPIAIVGVAIRLPGQVSNAQDLWQLMIEKKSGLIDVPRERWNIDGFHSEVPKPGTVQNRQAYYLDHVDLEKFDASCFSFSPQEIERLDPMQRQLLEITRECLENAGEVGWRNKDIGCYVGQFSGDWLEENAMDPHVSGLYRGSGFADFFLPNRVSYEYGWTGPSMTIKTGCSASMVAVHQAAEALRNRSCSAAIALSANLMTSPLTTVVYTEAGILSKTGKCKTFDSSADGYGRGEAVNAVLVKRLSDAIRDGNPIRAILRGSATNHDGREGKSGMLNPNTRAHEALIRKAYNDAGIEDFSQTAFFECHGTGTPAGDPQEVAAVARVFGDSGIVIGALKPNVGHAEGAAGLSSIIKAILALEKETIPPNIYFNNPNPRIPWKAANLVVPTDPMPWPQERAKRVSVNSFGVGGSNAHVILESYVRHDEAYPVNTTKTNIPRLILFSAGNEKSLSMQVERHQKYLNTNPTSLDDLAYTLGRRREHFSCRTFAIVDEKGKFEVSASQARQRVASRIVFVFTGQGAQSPGMGKRLIETNDVFRTTIRSLDGYLRLLSDAPSWSLEEELSKLQDSQIMKSEFSIPCSTAIQVALVDVLRSMNVRPKAVIGHSSGEIAAAYAAEIVTAREAIILAFYRGRSINDTAGLGPGAMAAVGLGSEAVVPYLIPGAVVACVNSQTNTTISGDKPAIEASLEQIRKKHPDVLARLLRVESAFHSHHMRPHGEAYESLIRPHLNAQPSKIPFFSTVTGGLATGDFGPEYWHMSFVEPVLFHSALQKLVKEHGNNVFLEIGPHPALQGPINQIMRSFPTARTEYVPTLRRNEDSATSLVRLAGNLFVQQVQLDVAAVVPQGRVLTDLPTYAWLHETTYIDAPRNAARYKHRKFARHDLLGARVLEGNDIEPAWRNMLELKDVHWLADHVVLDKIVFPGAGFIAVVGEAVRQASGGQSDGYTIRDLSISAPLMLTADKRTELYTRLIPASGTEEDGKWYDFKVMSFDGTQWASHCIGLVASAPQQNEDTGANVLQAPLPREVPTDEWYQTTRRVGYDWRLAFQGLDNITAGTVRHEATATIYDFDDISHYAVHPIVLDQCFQIALVAKTRGLRRNCVTLALPTSIDRIEVRGKLEAQMRVYSAAANAEEPVDSAYNAFITPDDKGPPLVSLTGMHFSDVPSSPYDDSLLLSTIGWETDITISGSISEFTNPLESYIRLLGWKYPTLRLLQAGTGDTTITHAAIDALQPRPGERFYSKFVYAVPKTETVDQVREQMSTVKNFEVVALDVPDSGLEVLSDGTLYDCIIVNKEFSTHQGRLPSSIKQLRQLLRPHGHLLVHNDYGQEAASSEWIQLASDLSRMGFMVGSVFTPSNSNVNFLVSKLSSPPNINPGVELLIHEGDSQKVAQDLQEHFTNNGIEIAVSTQLGTSAKPTVISLLDLDRTSVYSIDEDGFRPLIDSLTKFQGSIIWLLPPCQTTCNDPRAAMMVGLARTIRQEYNTDLTVVEADAASLLRDDFPSVLLSVYQSLATRDRFGGNLYPDYEYAVVDGVVKIPRLHWHGLSDETSTVAAARGAPTKALFREDGSYLLVGGLGGLGRAVATWMVENGARSLLFLSRSAADEANESFVVELESQGCKVQMAPGSVTDKTDVRRAISLAGPSLAGVMQLSMVLRDNSLATMTYSEWEACVKPKVQGTLELHEALSDVALDFLVLFSSGSGISGQHGQANYNAANTFIDAFVHFRHAQGLPAAVLDIGVMDDIGAVARSDQMVDIFRNAGHTFLREQDLLNGLSIAVASQQAGPRSQLILGVSTDKALSDPTNRTIWRRDVRMGVAHQFDRFSQVSADTGSTAQNEHAEFQALAKNHPEKLLEEDTLMAIARSIGSALSSLLVRPIDDFMLADPLDALGLDSVVAIELVSWLQRSFRVGFMTLEIIQCSSLLNLAERVAQRLLPN